LKVSGRSKDGLTATEERYRIEALQHLVDEGYPVANFVVEPVLKRFGNAGRNSFRADFAVLDVPNEPGHNEDWILEHAVVLGEVKRDNADAAAATAFQGSSQSTV
jgi:type I restriction enzyme M protein